MNELLFIGWNSPIIVIPLIALMPLIVLIFIVNDDFKPIIGWIIGVDILFIILYGIPLLIIYPIIEWLFKPNYSYGAFLWSHIAASSFIISIIILPILLIKKYRDFNDFGLQKNYFIFLFDRKNIWVALLTIFLSILTIWSIAFFIIDIPKSQDRIAAGTKRLKQIAMENKEDKAIVDSAAIRFNEIKSICNVSIDNSLQNYRFRTDSLIIIMINEKVESIPNVDPWINTNVKSFEECWGHLNNAEALFGLNCVACISETFKETGMEYYIGGTIPGKLGIKAVIYYWSIKLIDINSKKTTADTTIIGPNPPDHFTFRTYSRKYYGIQPYEQFDTWFKALPINISNSK